MLKLSVKKNTWVHVPSFKKCKRNKNKIKFSLNKFFMHKLDVLSYDQI